jgi:hypothetical protein
MNVTQKLFGPSMQSHEDRRARKVESTRQWLQPMPETNPLCVLSSTLLGSRYFMSSCWEEKHRSLSVPKISKLSYPKEWLLIGFWLFCARSLIRPVSRLTTVLMGEL